MKRNQKIILVGFGPATLRESDHIGTGGEGSAYRVGSVVVKIFTDPNKMLTEDMAGKIQLLSAIRHPWIMAPQGVVTDEAHKPIGYYMPMANGEALPRFFTNDFRAQVSFGITETSTLVERMRETVGIAHQQKALIVDGNEYGWLVSFDAQRKPEPQIVDVDSWQIGRWPARVIMPSIRDYHARDFSQLTDWFSWGVVTFQAYTGIHPYKGTMDGFARNDFVARMKANASVFARGVRLNRAVRDFGAIPSKLLNWYRDTFQLGERSKPPSPFDKFTGPSPTVTTARAVVSQVSGLLMFQKIYSSPAKDSVRRIFPCGVAWLKSGALVNLQTGLRLGKAGSGCEVVRVKDGWLVLETNRRRTSAWYTTGQQDRTDLAFPIDASAILRSQDRLFAVTEAALIELSLQVFAQPILTLGTSWQAMPSSTRFFDGLGIQDSLGAKFLLLPHGGDSLSYVRIPELDGLAAVNAKAGQSFVSVVCLDRQGNYRKFEFTFSKDYDHYSVWSTDTDTPELNVVSLPAGVCATVIEDGELVVFVPRNGNTNKFKDSSISTDEPLFAWDNRVLLVRGCDVWHVSVKP